MYAEDPSISLRRLARTLQQTCSDLQYFTTQAAQMQAGGACMAPYPSGPGPQAPRPSLVNHLACSMESAYFAHQPRFSTFQPAALGSGIQHMSHPASAMPGALQLVSYDGAAPGVAPPGMFSAQQGLGPVEGCYPMATQRTTQHQLVPQQVYAGGTEGTCMGAGATWGTGMAAAAAGLEPGDGAYLEHPGQRLLPLPAFPQLSPCVPFWDPALQPIVLLASPRPGATATTEPALLHDPALQQMVMPETQGWTSAAAAAAAALAATATTGAGESGAGAASLGSSEQPSVLPCEVRTIGMNMLRRCVCKLGHHISWT